MKRNDQGECVTVCRETQWRSRCAGLLGVLAAGVLAACGAVVTVAPGDGASGVDASSTGDATGVTCVTPTGARVPPGTTFQGAGGCSSCTCAADGTAPCIELPCVPPMPGCVLPDGSHVDPGTSFRAPDGCNTCTCSSSGAIACTELGCATDGGSGPGEPGCRLNNGTYVPPGTSFPAGDGCNTCSCAASGEIVCTQRDCAPPDASIHPPVNTCTSSSQCASGYECFGMVAGCAIPWTCQPATGRLCTDDIAPFCSCSGTTIYGSSTCPPGPYQHTGACSSAPGDSGVAPAYDCRQSQAFCDRLPPTCPAGTVPALNGHCWSDVCVTLAQCGNPTCVFSSANSSADCPYGTTCTPDNRCSFVIGD